MPRKPRKTPKQNWLRNQLAEVRAELERRPDWKRKAMHAEVRRDTRDTS